jgi:hypothetical protein
MNPHEAAEPGVFELLLPPQLRDGLSLLADLGRQLPDGPVNVEQRAIGVEHACPDSLELGHLGRFLSILRSL